MDHQEVGCGRVDWIDLAQDLSLIDKLVKQWGKLCLIMHIPGTLNGL